MSPPTLVCWWVSEKCGLCITQHLLSFSDSRMPDGDGQSAALGQSWLYLWQNLMPSFSATEKAQLRNQMKLFCLSTSFNWTRFSKWALVWPDETGFAVTLYNRHLVYLPWHSCSPLLFTALRGLWGRQEEKRDDAGLPLSMQQPRSSGRWKSYNETHWGFV